MAGKDKGGRPAHHEGEVKKAAIAVRTAPSIKAKLEEAAASSGRSVTQEVEARLTASLLADGGSRSPETERLLTQIGHAIAEIEAMTGKRWHKDRKTYGAMLEMLSFNSPAHSTKVDDPADDDLVQAAWDEYWEILQSKRSFIEGLAHLGIKAETEPRHHNRNALLGSGMFGGGSGGSALSHLSNLPSRWSESHELEKADLPQKAKEVGQSLIDGLQELDTKGQKAREKWYELGKPYIEAEQAGRALFRELMQKKETSSLLKGFAGD